VSDDEQPLENVNTLKQGKLKDISLEKSLFGNNIPLLNVRSACRPILTA